MIEFLLKIAAKAALVAAVLYVSFFVDLGSRSLFQHLSRISETEEAQELGSALEQVVHDSVIVPAKAFWNSYRSSAQATAEPQ